MDSILKKAILIGIVFSVSNLLVSCSLQAKELQTQQAANLKQAKITFNKDKIYEISYVSIIPGKEQQIFADYFPKVLPLAAKYGGKSMGMLAIPGVKDGSNQAKMAAIFEWPSIDSWLQLHKDKEFLKIVPIRDSALSFANPANFYTVDENIKATFTEGKMYELANYTLKQDDDGWSSKKKVFDNYFSRESQLAKSNGSAQDITLTPVPLSNHMKNTIDITCGHHNGYGSDDLGLVPHITRIREWNSFDSFEQHKKSRGYKRANKLKNEAVQHELKLKTVFGFPAS